MSDSHNSSGDEKIEEKQRVTQEVIETPPEPPKPNADLSSLLSKGEKWFIVMLTACVGLFR